MFIRHSYVVTSVLATMKQDFQNPPKREESALTRPVKLCLISDLISDLFFLLNFSTKINQKILKDWLKNSYFK